MKDWTDIVSFAEDFEWDEGNIKKDWERHRVSHIECEEIFFNRPIIVKKDEPHSTSEDRYFVLGKTDAGRLLFIVFTLRGNKIRIISARDMNRKERKIYEETQEDTQV
ncbi:MAG: BrnT family toxin [Thermodesulfovibrionales bacterium]